MRVTGFKFNGIIADILRGRDRRISGFFLKIKTMWRRFINLNDENFGYRLAALAGAAVLGIFALVLGLSLLGAVFGIKAFNPLLGTFFSHSYGILAFFIPIYLGFAAVILADSRWRPDHIYTLCVSLLPFLTLGIGFIFLRDFDMFAREYAFLDFTGRIGFGIIIVILTLFEVVVLQILKNAIFPGGSRGEKRKWPDTSGPSLLPPPKANLNEIYADAAATGEWVDDSKLRADSADENGKIELDLPRKRPLNTPLALEYLNETREEGQNRTDNKGLSDSVERALEEAEVIAAIHSEQARKKSSASHSGSAHKRKYSVPLEILNQYPDGEYWVIDQATRDAAITLKDTLEEFKIQAEVTGIRKGPVITMFEILPAPGVKLSRIVNLQDNIALRLAASSVRIVAPIPGKHAVGIEVPNAKRNIVSFREIIEGELQREGKRPEIPVVMGKNISGEALTVDLTQTPHLLIAGATGSGKSVCVNAMILSILYQLPPSDCRLILIDPKIVELKLYNDIPHLLTPVITEPKKAFQALQYCICEMERRYACLDSMGDRKSVV